MPLFGMRSWNESKPGTKKKKKKKEGRKLVDVFSSRNLPVFLFIFHLHSLKNRQNKENFILQIFNFSAPFLVFFVFFFNLAVYSVKTQKYFCVKILFSEVISVCKRYNLLKAKWLKFFFPKKTRDSVLFLINVSVLF